MKWLNTYAETKPTYHSWAAMKRRCYNSNDRDFHNYGGRGITVCDRWRESYDDFIEDMGFRPAGLTLERRDNDKNYEPENCYWADRKSQANNRRGNRILEGDTVARQARKVGMTRQAMLYRADNGIPVDQGKRPDEALHGTVSRYTSQKHKCRCAECREAWRLYNFRKRK